MQFIKKSLELRQECIRKVTIFLIVPIKDKLKYFSEKPGKGD